MFEDEREPKLVLAFSQIKIVRISCGAGHTVAVDGKKFEFI
jgi:adenylosuccinate synthase